MQTETITGKKQGKSALAAGYLERGWVIANHKAKAGRNDTSVMQIINKIGLSISFQSPIVCQSGGVSCPSAVFVITCNK